MKSEKSGFLRAILVAGLSAAALPALSASDRGSPAEARAMLGKAAAHYMTAGRKRALADFTAKKPPFSDRDLYVVCIGSDRNVSANGAFPKYVATSADALKDASGKPLAGAMLAAASAKGKGAVRYTLINPASGKAEPKITYVRNLGGDVCGVAAYDPR
jgi:cytochrome c